ncbi:unnamed protein product [Mucor hiemalis]
MGIFSGDLLKSKVNDGSKYLQLGNKQRSKEYFLKAADYYRKGAEEFDHGECQYELGRLYLLLDIVETPKLDLVVYWYKKAISNNVSRCELPLTIALVYLFGDYDIKNETEALKWIEKAAEMNSECYTVIGDAYYAGGVPFDDEDEIQILGAREFTKATTKFVDQPRYKFTELEYVDKNYGKALEWYLKAAKRLPHKDAPATKIALIYLHGGHGVGKNYQKVLDWSERYWGEDCKLVYKIIKIIITVYREGGHGVGKDAQKALTCCSLDKNQPLYFEAGEIYQFYMYPPDFKKAAVCYEKSFERKKTLARERIGYLYLKGLGVKKDLSRATEFLKNDYYRGYFSHYGIESSVSHFFAEHYYKLCKRGDRFYGKALNQLGLLHQVNSKDFEKAIQLFNAAAEENCHDAFNSLGDVYKYGYGVNVDYEEAFKWYSKAAEEPMDNGGQLNLAMMYSEGKGTQVNYKLALHWFEKAKMYGNEQVNPLFISQTRTLVEYSEKIGILEAQLKNVHTNVQKSEDRELPKMFHVQNKQR